VFFVKKKCPTCGYENPSEAKYCINCGYKFPIEAVKKETVEFKDIFSTYINISLIVSIVYILDILFNEIYHALFRSIFLLGYIISIVGVIIILYIYFFRKNSIYPSTLKFFIYGNILAGIGCLIVFIIPIIIGGHYVVSIYWIIFLYLAYKTYKI